jgi:hypothetical protein
MPYVLCYHTFSMDRRKLVYYLILNIFVSACVTSAMLFWYDRNYRAVTQPAVLQAGLSSGQSTPAATLSLQTDIPINIESVIGAGTLNAEVVIIKFEGQGQLNVAGWQLKDDDGNTFTLPQLTLYTNGAVQIHSASGTDTVIDLYWGAGEAIWQSGEDARLFDPQGNLRALYRVP